MGLPDGGFAPRAAGNSCENKCGQGAACEAACGSALRLLGIAGWSGSGKTTLIVALLPLLRSAGLRVSTIKHAHHGLDLDRPGKDSFRHREAGAEEVLVVGGQRWALMRETPEMTPDPVALAARLEPVDLVLVEGFKASELPKIEVFRPSLGKPALWPADPGVVAVASDAETGGGHAWAEGCMRPLLPLNDSDAIARWIVAFAARRPGPA